MVKSSTYGVTVNLDKARKLRWTGMAKADFEDDVSAWAPKAGIQLFPGIGTEQILTIMLEKERVLQFALFRALKHEDEKLTQTNVAEMLDAYREKGGDDDELRDRILEAFKISDGIDPSIISSWKKNSEASRRRAKLQAKALAKKMEKTLEETEKDVIEAEKELNALIGAASQPGSA
jgi:hypothetical protein